MQYLGLAYELIREQVIDLIPNTPTRCMRLVFFGAVGFGLYSCTK